LTILLFLVQLSQRFWNAHAMINMAVWLRKEQPSLASSIRSRLGVKGVSDAAHRISEVRVVIGSPRAELQGESALIVTPETSQTSGTSLLIPKAKMEASQLLLCYFTDSDIQGATQSCTHLTLGKKHVSPMESDPAFMDNFQ